MPRTKKTMKNWSVTEIMNGVKDAAWVQIGGDFLEDKGIHAGDYLLIDRSLKKAKEGDVAVYQMDSGGFSVWCVQDGYEADEGTIYGLGVGVVRRFNRKRKRATSTRISSDRDQQRQATIRKLQEQLARLETLPENESARFKLETEIFQLEREGNIDAEWPDEIAAQPSPTGRQNNGHRPPEI